MWEKTRSRFKLLLLCKALWILFLIIFAKIVKGCLDRRSTKYGTNYATYQPNEEICNEDYKFGGTFAYTYHCTNPECLNTYQPCQEVNILTNTFECPTGYESILVFQTKNVKGPWANLTECRSKHEGKGSLYFGGIYSTSSKNPLTNDSSCPKYFSSQPLLDCLNNRICLTEDARAISNAVPFGGFISSCMPESSQDCMQGYTKVKINTYNECTLYYCVQLKSWNRPSIETPPFIQIPPPQHFKVGQIFFIKDKPLNKWTDSKYT